MSLSNYPPGAEYDRNAPYNWESTADLTFNCKATYTISKSDIEVETDEYEIDDATAIMYEEAFDCSPVDVMEKAARLLADYKAILQENDKYKVMCVQSCINELTGWHVQDSEVEADKIDLEPPQPEPYDD